MKLKPTQKFTAFSQNSQENSQNSVNFARKFAQKAVLSAIASGILASNALATGIPTIDVGSLTQSVLQYAEMLKSNTQMLQSYAQQIEQVKMQAQQVQEQGIGMSIGDILGDTKSLLNKTLANIDFKIEEDTLQETKDITEVCAYLEQNSQHFKENINKVGQKLENKVNACITTAGTNGIAQTINELTSELNALDYEEVEKRNEIEHKINMINQAQSFLAQQANSQKTSKILAMYDNYLEGDANNPYSKAKFDEDLKVLSEQLSKSNNQKQTAALTNTMLLKLLEVSQKQYELSLNMASMNANAEKSPTQDISYTQEKPKIIKTEDLETVKAFKEEYGEAAYDEYGMPDMSILTKIED